LLKINFSRLLFPGVTVTAGCWNILGCCEVWWSRQAGGGEVGLQTGRWTNRLNKPPPHAANGQQLIIYSEMKLCRLVNRPFMTHTPILGAYCRQYSVPISRIDNRHEKNENLFRESILRLSFNMPNVYQSGTEA